MLSIAFLVYLMGQFSCNIIFQKWDQNSHFLSIKSDHSLQSLCDLWVLFSRFPRSSRENLPIIENYLWEWLTHFPSPSSFSNNYWRAVAQPCALARGAIYTRIFYSGQTMWRISPFPRSPTLWHLASIWTKTLTHTIHMQPAERQIHAGCITNEFQVVSVVNF